MKATIRLRDVAEHAGVSPATVSRTINGDERVDAALRGRVEASIEVLGYRRNMLARNLRRQRIDQIGVVVFDIENPHFSETIKVAEDEAFRLGYRIVVCGTDDSRDLQASYLRMFADQRVAGVILAPSDPAGPEITALLDAGIPIVAVDRGVVDKRVDAVLADNVSGVATATQLLIDAGHTAIAYVSGRKGTETSSQRVAGYRRAMRRAGLPTRIVVGDFRMEPARRAVAELLEGGSRPTALVVGSNLMVLGALRAAHDAGIRIPEDLALVGIDDPYWAEYVNPPITSVAQPVAAMAREAVDMVVARINGDTGPPRRSLHSFGVVIRASSGPIPGTPVRGRPSGVG